MGEVCCVRVLGAGKGGGRGSREPAAVGRGGEGWCGSEKDQEGAGLNHTEPSAIGQVVSIESS